MTKTYDSLDAAGSYEQARLMPGCSMRQWMDLLLAAVPPNAIKTLLDLGCGTGHFSFALAEAYQCRVLAVDPSQPMLEKGRLAARPGQDIVWRQPPNSCFDET